MSLFDNYRLINNIKLSINSNIQCEDVETHKTIRLFKSWFERINYINISPLIACTKFQKIHSNKEPLMYNAVTQILTRDNKQQETDLEKFNLDRFKDVFNKNTESFNVGLLKYFNNIYALLENYKNKRIEGLIYNNEYIGIDIQLEFETHDIMECIVNDEVNKIYLSYYYPIFQSPPIQYTESEHRKMINKVLKLIITLRYVLNIQKPISVVIFASTQKKIISDTINTLLPNNVNTGMTDMDTIYLWRLEELEKVLIHELIHYSGIATTTFDNYKRINSVYKKYGKIRNLSEVYTETLALILYSVYISSQFPELSVSNILCCQKIYSLISIKKLFEFLGKPFKTRTNIHEYLIAKFALIVKTGLYLDIMADSIKLADIENEFVTLLIRNIKNLEHYLKYVDLEYLKYSYPKYMSDLLFSTCRLTI